MPARGPDHGPSGAPASARPNRLLPEDDHPDSQDDLAARAVIEARASGEHQFGRLGQPIDRRSPFFVGLVGALGVATAFLLAWAVFTVRQVLILLVLALFVAVGLDPAVRWLQRRGLPRWGAVILVVLAAMAVLAGFLALAVPVLVTQIGQLAHQIPHYFNNLSNRHTLLGRLNAHYHVVSRLQRVLSTSGTSLASGLVGFGRVVIGLFTGILVVIVVSVYLLADLPRVKRGIYQLAPRSRRARMVLLTDEIFARVGGYVLGNLLTSVIAGLGTWIWAEIFGIPYPVLLGFLVALFDLVPIVGSTVGGVIVALVALAVSVPVAIGTAGFYLVYRLLEDYLLTPRIMGRTVEVPGLVTVVATLLGGALLGVVGALIAIPVAAAVKLIVSEVTIPRLERE